MRDRRASISALVRVIILAAAAASPATAQAQVIEDVTLPAIAGFSLSPTAIDVTAAARSVTVTQRLTDDRSGIWYGCFVFRSPTSQQYRSNCINDPYDLVSGTNLDGVWQKDVDFPRGSEAGEWHLYYAYVADRVGNQRFYYEQDFIALGFPTTLIVTTTPDNAPPSLVSWGFEPSTIDVSAGGQAIGVSLRLTDDRTGIWYGCFVFRSPTFQQYRSNCINDPYDLASGTNLDGAWKKDLHFPQFSEAGEWHVYYAYVADHVGNQRFYYEPELMALGLPTTVQIVSQPDDVTAPFVAGFDYTPRWINTSTGPADVRLSLRLTDGLAGVWYGCVVFRSPSFQQYRSNCINDPYDLVSGTGLDGVWQKDLHFPQFSETGEWHMYYAYVADKVGNQRFLYEQDMATLGFPTTLSVRAADPDTTAPALAVTLSADTLWSPNHALVTITASITVSDALDPNPAVELVSITSSEPDNGLGDGDTSHDIQGAAPGTDDRVFQLRAERSGTGNGRIYSITYRATDASGNATTVVKTVSVPRSRGKG